MPLPLPVTSLTRYERISDITMIANTPLNLPTQGGQMPTERHIHSLVLEMEGRATMAASTGATAVLADAPFSIIERLTVEGYHRPRSNNEKFIDLRGVDLRKLCEIYDSRPQLQTPLELDLAVSATNDFRFIIVIPFVPLKLPPQMQMGWLLDAPNYEQLKFTVQFGSVASLFVEGATATTLSAFGSSTGSPRLRVGANFVMGGGSRFQGFVPGKVYRTSQDITTEMQSTANGVRLFNIPRGNQIRSMILKTGVRATAASSGNTVYATLTESALTNIRFFRGLNRVIRDWNSMRDIAQDSIARYAGVTPFGHALIDMCPNGVDDELLDLRAAVSGPTGDVDTFLQADVLTASNQMATLIYEEWRHRPTVF